MNNIKKSLTNYITDKGPMPSIEEILSCEDANECLDIIFSLLNSEVERQNGETSLGKGRNIIKLIAVIINNYDQVDRKLTKKRIHKLEAKIDHIKIENKNKFSNIQKAYTEFDKTIKELEQIESIVEEKNTKQYDLVRYIIEETKDITYVEHTFLKMPNLVNTKDKDGNILYYNVLKKYMESVIDDNQEDSLYYSNVLALISNKKSFNFSEREKKKCLEEIYKQIDKLSIGKRKQKKNKDKIETLNNLISNLKQECNEEIKISQIGGKYNISVFFNDAINQKAKVVRIPKEGEMTDREVLNDYFITIDKEGAIEIDDALACTKNEKGNFIYIISIASPLGYFDYHSDIIQEALKRTQSIYLRHKYQDIPNDFNRTIPIFPYEFSARTASLVPGESKLTRSYIFEITPEGKIVSERFIKSITKSHKKTTYREIDDIITNGSDNKKLEETVKNLCEVTSILEKKYKAADLYEKIKENTEDPSDLRVKSTGSEKIVYQAMLLTGNRVAEFFARNNYPCLYRVHQINNENAEKLQALIDNLTDTYGGDQFKKLYELIEGIYPKGWYAESGEHAGLKLKNYCHVTSALRRAADIVVEHALEVCHDKTPTPKDLEKLQLEIQKQSQEINSKQKPIEWFVKEYKRSYQRRR